jgi:hypothetical protein
MDARQAKRATSRNSKARAKRTMTRMSRSGGAAVSSLVRGIDRGSLGLVSPRAPAPRGAPSVGTSRVDAFLLSIATTDRPGSGAGPPRSGAARGLSFGETLARPWAEAAAEEIRETGEVSCPLRMGAHVARDRCISNQHGAGACRCPAGLVARRVGALEAIDEAAEETRRAEATDSQRRRDTRRRWHTGAPEVWTIVCAYRGCGKTAVFKRGWHPKPKYCTRAHGRLESKARKADRAGGVGG